MNIYDVALRRLGTRSRTVNELKEYLVTKEFSLSEIEPLIEEFLDNGYLDDIRYCHEYFKYAFEKGKGKNRVFTELKGKGVKPEDIIKAFSQYEGDVDESSRAKKEAEKVLRGEGLSIDDMVPEKIRGRIGRRLSSLGYTANVIYGILEDLKR